MRIDKLYIESGARAWPATQGILEKIQAAETKEITDYQDFFSRRKTAYLKKRSERNLFIAVKRGAMVKEAPPAYGFGAEDLHYYYVHAYNCVYECEYCYLQGYFSSPDLVLFVNHADAVAEMQHIANLNRGRKRVWFHAGEFSDSLALSHISGELPVYWDFFTENPEAFLELRTKSTNLSVLRSLPPLPNIVVSFSLATAGQAAKYDHETPAPDQRIAAMQRLAALGFRLGLHFDPIIYDTDFATNFEATVQHLAAMVGFDAIVYISVGAVRFAKDVFREAKENYPDSAMFARNFIQGADNKMRYIRPLRLFLIETAQQILKKHGCPEEKIYICME